VVTSAPDVPGKTRAYTPAPTEPRPMTTPPTRAMAARQRRVESLTVAIAHAVVRKSRPLVSDNCEHEVDLLIEMATRVAGACRQATRLSALIAHRAAMPMTSVALRGEDRSLASISTTWVSAGLSTVRPERLRPVPPLA